MNINEAHRIIGEHVGRLGNEELSEAGATHVVDSAESLWRILEERAE